MRFAARTIARLSLAVIALLGAAGQAAFAQSACETALQVAEKSYELGLFEDVPGQLEPCLEGQSRAESVRTQALLAKTYLATDEIDEAREAVAELLRIDPAFDPASEADAPPRFTALVAEVRRSESELQVATVSKTSESLREAPATVVVIRAEEIERRGYLDLEQVLHDLPGFDISRGNGETYSTFYQRGFRSKDNDRILLLVDGVEQNDLSSGVAHLSRQYPVSTVDRIEVVYGPASTIYGANAYSGVINIITKPPEAFLPEGKRFGALVQAASGSFDTRATELTLAGRDRSGSVAWSLAGRLYRSDENDLSGFPGRRYDFSAVDYKTLLRLTGSGIDDFCSLAGAFDFDCFENPELPPGALFVGRPNGEYPQVIELTDEGERVVRALDSAVLPPAFSDPTEDWSLYAKLRLANLTLGLQAARREEGTAPWFEGARHVPASWTPKHTSLYVKYGRSLGKSLSLNLFTRYLQTEFDPRASGRTRLHTYANGALGLVALGFGCSESDAFCPRVEVIEAPRQLASQSAAEATLVYAPRRQFTLVGGLDVKKGSIQTQQEGLVDELVDHTDLGLYAQASYKPLPALSLVAGGRLDYNEANGRSFTDTGFGTLFSPRLAVVYLPGRWAFKAIYSEAFKDPSDFEKFSAEEREERDFKYVRNANPTLRPERTRSVELSAGWHPRDDAALEVAAYRTRYDDLVVLDECDYVREVTCGEVIGALPLVVEQFQNNLAMDVEGIELSARGRIGRVSLFGNATYVDPRGTVPPAQGETGPPREARVGDIARQRANLGVDLQLWKKLGLNLRWNYVGARRTGAGTTVSTNPLTQVDAYSLAHATLTYADVLPGVSLQLIVNNLLDEAYVHPGVAAADGLDLAASIPQPGRTVYARVTWGLGRSREASQENK